MQWSANNSFVYREDEQQDRWEAAVFKHKSINDGTKREVKVSGP